MKYFLILSIFLINFQLAEAASLSGFVDNAISLVLTPILTIAFVLMFIYSVWYFIKYIREARATGKEAKSILFIITMFFLALAFSVFAIFIANTFFSYNNSGPIKKENYLPKILR